MGIRNLSFRLVVACLVSGVLFSLSTFARPSAAEIARSQIEIAELRLSPIEREKLLDSHQRDVISRFMTERTRAVAALRGISGGWAEIDDTYQTIFRTAENRAGVFLVKGGMVAWVDPLDANNVNHPQVQVSVITRMQQLRDRVLITFEDKDGKTFRLKIVKDVPGSTFKHYPELLIGDGDGNRMALREVLQEKLPSIASRAASATRVSLIDY